jgi:hypothetical protein
MNHTRTLLFTALLVFLTTTAAAGDLSGYITKGFQSRDAMLSAYFALAPAQQATAHIDAMQITRSCAWSDPWVMTYRGAAGETDDAHYETETIPEENRWVVDWISHGQERTIVRQLTDRAAPYVIIHWHAPFCVAIP